MTRAASVRRFASISCLAASLSACEFESYLDGVVRNPGEKCAAADEEPVARAAVELSCPTGSSAKVVDRRAVMTDDKGTFEITVLGLDALPACRLRVSRETYKPFERPLSELDLRKDPQLHGRVFVKVQLERDAATR